MGPQHDVPQVCLIPEIHGCRQSLQRHRPVMQTLSRVKHGNADAQQGSLCRRHGTEVMRMDRDHLRLRSE